MATKKGKCKNIDGCDKAFNNEIQEVDSINFVCEECGKPLEEYKEKPKPPIPYKRIGIICGSIIVVVLMVLGGIKMFSDSTPQDENVPQSVTPDKNVEETKDTPKPNNSVRIHDTTVKETENKNTISSSPTRKNNGELNLGYSIYNGPISNGKAHGSGGTLRFTRSYTIDLKQLSGEKVVVNSGDRMLDVTMNNNRLISGLLKKQNGDTRWINIGE